MSSAVPVAMTSEAVAWEFYNICRLNAADRKAGGDIDAYYSYYCVGHTDVSLVLANYMLACYTGYSLLLFMNDKDGVVPARNSVIETQMYLVKFFNPRYVLHNDGISITVKDTEDGSEIPHSGPWHCNTWYSITVPISDIDPIIRLDTKPLTFADMEGVL